jgi:hypothetical protein
MNKILLGYSVPLVAILAVIVGWLLNEFSAWVKIRRDDRRAIGQALSELLSIRHRLQTVSFVVIEIKKRVPIPPASEVAVRNFFESFLPDIGDIQSRYGQAIDLVAGRMPLLAFELRSKEMIGPNLQRLRSLVPPEQIASSFVLGLENQLVDDLLPTLERLLRKLAWHHGWITWIDVRQQLRTQVHVPERLREMLDRAAVNAQNSTSPKSPT